MTRILFVGQKPETVDFSDPALPPGFDAEKINAGIAVAVAKIEERCRIALYREIFKLSNFNRLGIALNLRHCT